MVFIGLIRNEAVARIAVPHNRLSTNQRLLHLLLFSRYLAFGSKHVGVTSFTCQSHVTSSVTWPFDPPYFISYWWSFGINCLYL